LVVYKAEIGARNICSFGVAGGDGENKDPWHPALDIVDYSANGVAITTRITHAMP
jgi:hypothetical protein